MIGKFSAQDGTVLQEMLAESASSIIVKTDINGFIEDASPGLDSLGFCLKDMLFKPHLADLAMASHAEALRKFHKQVLAAGRSIGSIEFPVARSDEPPSWFSLSLRPAPTTPESGEGALGLLRSIERQRNLERELAAASMTDMTTGLANSRAFHAMLAQMLSHKGAGAVVVFEIDRLASLKLKYGHTVADEILWAFGRFLENMLDEKNVLARLDGDRFAVLLPDSDSESAIGFAGETIETFEEISGGSPKSHMRLSASAGIATLAGSLDAVLVSAERALVVARALGGGRAEICGQIEPWKAQASGS